MVILNQFAAGPPSTKGPTGTFKQHRSRALLFSVSTTVAAVLALVVAMVAGIDRPWWAAMTVWLVAQPTRGLLLERSLARLTGTAVGAGVGFVLLWGLSWNPLLLLGVLALWVGLCAGAGALFRHSRNYGFVVAGYSAGIVAIFGLMQPQNWKMIAGGRIVCAVIGILSLALISGIVTQKESNQFELRLRQLIALTVAWLGDTMDVSCHGDKLGSRKWDLLAKVGTLEPLTDVAAAGSLHAHRYAQQQRKILAACLCLLAAGNQSECERANTDCLDGAAASLLKTAAGDFAQAGDTSALERALSAAQGHLAGRLPEIAFSLKQLAISLEAPQQAQRAFWAEFLPDWSDASVAAFRSIAAVIITAAIWQTTGWSGGPLMVMTATLFTCLFSNHSRAVPVVHDVLIGSLLGAFLGLFCRIVLLPYVEGLVGTLIVIAPFLAFGAWLMARPSTAKIAIDLTMTFLLSVQPGRMAVDPPMVVVGHTVALLAGVIAAVLTFYIVLPATPHAKLNTLNYRTKREWKRLRGARSSAVARFHYQRVCAQTMRMAVVVQHTNHRERHALNIGLKTLFQCEAVFAHIDNLNATHESTTQ